MIPSEYLLYSIHPSPFKPMGILRSVLTERRDADVASDMRASLLSHTSEILEEPAPRYAYVRTLKRFQSMIHPIWTFTCDAFI